jgi:heme/copper-type cytochrome/quinol oxidase subunit 2
VAGRHVGRLRASCAGMVGMMVGMTMGMMTGFVLGYGAAAATNSMFWGNVLGILSGLALGVYHGRSAGLMGMMDGGMGGVMGGSMGAMLAVMLRVSSDEVLWTAALLAALFLLGMVALAALVEQNSPDHSHLHRVLPIFARLQHTGFSIVESPAPPTTQPSASGAPVAPTEDAPPPEQGTIEVIPGGGPSKGALVIGVSGGLLLVLALGLKLLAPAPAAPLPVLGPDPNDPTTQAVLAPIADDGRQTLDLVIDGDTMSYQPRAIKVKQGRPVRFNLSTAGRDPGCGRLVVVYGVGAQGVAILGQVVPMDFTPPKPGVYEINCGMKMMQPGYLVVTD